MAAKKDDRITKRKVTMKSVTLSADGKTTLEHVAEDYVRPDHLDAYVADARTKWQAVEVSDEPDAGPRWLRGRDGRPCSSEPAGCRRHLPGRGEVAHDHPDSCDEGPAGHGVQDRMRSAGALSTTTAPRGRSRYRAVTGGAPAYARKADLRGAPRAIGVDLGVGGAPSTFQTGQTIVGFEIFSATSAGTYYDGVRITSQAFASQGTYAVTPTYTQT